MFTEILKIIPKLDPSALAQMESSLGKRFTRIAKSFGNGLKNVLLGGGIAGVAGGILDKVLNPLKETQEAMEKLLGESNDISTFAKQFGTSSGNLFKLQQLGAAKGLGPEEIRTLLLKFQSSIVEAQANPSEPSAVRQFVGQKDIAEGFIQFIQSLNKMTAAQQLFVQTQVFGEKQVLKMAEFLRTEDFGQLAKDLKLKNSGVYTQRIEKASGLADQNQVMKTARETSAFEQQLGTLSLSKVQSNNAFEAQRSQQDTLRLQSYDNLKMMQISMDKVSIQLEKGFLTLAKAAPAIADALDVISKSRFLRGAGSKPER